MTYFDAIFLGLLQGVTELFPISSLGHTVIIPTLFHMQVDQRAPSFLFFIVATHFTTALVLLVFFWKDWLKIITGMFRSLRMRVIREDDTYAKLGWLLVIGTIPAGILGLLFEDTLKQLFATPLYAAFFLMCNGVLLYGAEYLGKKNFVKTSAVTGDSAIAHLTWMQSVKVGVMQCLALLPGFSRTGATLVGGLGVGLTHEEAARFSFLLATPIIFAAAALKLPELALSNDFSHIIGPILVGMITAGIGAYLSVRFLTRYFKTQTLTLFAMYCFAAGIIAMLVIR
jgi:undecaprenyl-diphosphatase